MNIQLIKTLNTLRIGDSTALAGKADCGTLTEP
jgi:hypothetical protein